MNRLLLALSLAACPADGFLAAPRPMTPPTELRGARVTTESGLSYEDTLVGSGPVPGRNDYVSVHYDAKFAKTGKYFDSSRPEEVGLEETRRPVFRGKPIQIPLGRGAVIAGMDEGVATMNVGGKRRLFIPSELGYGERGYPPKVAPNTDLVFDVEMVSIDNMMSGQLGSAGSLFNAFKFVFGLIAVNGLTEYFTGTELRAYIYDAISGVN